MKGFWNITNTIPVTLSFIFLFIYNQEKVFAVPTRHLCRPEQREALVQLKNEFEVFNSSSDYICYINGTVRVTPHPKTESWESNNDCCTWEGVTCNPESGEVIKLDLNCSYLRGQLHSNINFQNLQSLTSLDLSSNDFSGQIMSSIGNLPLLTSLDLSANRFSGQIPSFIGNLFHLSYLNLYKNKLSGQLPSWIGNLSHLTQLFLGSNNFSGQIPSTIGKLSLKTLDLSNNKFNGVIPHCMVNLKRTLFDLNLRQNRLHGGFPEYIFESLRSLDVGHNQLTGKLPRALIHSTYLEVLNVENNIINDTFPSWLSFLPNLKVIVLRSNAFHGPILKASFSKLQIIDISHNHFSGALPSDYFVKWSAMSSLPKNKDKLNRKYMGDVYYYDSLVLMNKGVVTELVRILKIYTALDFSRNKLEGKIPRSIGLLKELHVLNLSNNAFSGHIPSSMGNLSALESLDVSQNQLSGGIPQELGSLSYLAYMNFSANNLSGLVPEGTQFARQNCSFFAYNLALYGPSIDGDCGDIHTPTSHNETKESEEGDEEVLSWIAAVIGAVPGAFLGVTLGCIAVSCRPEWFVNPFVRNKRRRRNTATR